MKARARRGEKAGAELRKLPRIRKARAADMEAIFLMGRDAWGAGKEISEYLESCRNSPKYEKGEWYLLEDGAGAPAASLIVYRLPPDGAGIGSLAVAPEKRGKGHAARLIKDVLRRLDRRRMSCVFLFSDIGPEFYAPFGFTALPAKHQKRAGGVCMIRGRSASARIEAAGFRPPDYF
jgi:predicted N-acetyltransferase YhbS